MSIKSDIKEFVEYYDLKLEESLKSFKGIPDNLYKAVEYILFSGGKRIRPFIMIESFKMFSDKIEDVIDFAIALEMIHTYSLVHDDLPAMDDDDYRRGKLTVHKVYGEDTAILVGDTLLNCAFEVIAKKLDRCTSIEDFKLTSTALLELSNYSGAYGMIGGQVLDMEIEKSNDEIDIIEMYSLKTGGLFKACTVIGSILGNATDKDIELMREFGEKLGLAYQIQDDILDHEEDEKINKVTVSTKFGKDEAEKIANKYTDRALEILSEINSSNTVVLETLTKELMGRSY